MSSLWGETHQEIDAVTKFISAIMIILWTVSFQCSCIKQKQFPKNSHSKRLKNQCSSQDRDSFGSI
jgi:hypothetical protein